MQWLAPWAWLGLGALVVPVFVHLFSRRPAHTEPFPSLRFLAVSPVAPTRRTRIADWPLLLLRLLILTLAVAALAQPLRTAAMARVATRGTTIEVLDVATGSTGTVSVPQADSGATVETIRTPDVEAGIAQAVARLRSRPAPRTVHVRSPFPDGSLDTIFLATLPRDVALVFTPTPATTASGTSADTIAWQTALPAREASAVIDAVAALGGSRVVITRDGTPRTARVLVVSASDADTRARSSAEGGGGDSLPAWASDRALDVSRDEPLRMALRSARSIDGTTSGTSDRVRGSLTLVSTARGDAALVARMRGQSERSLTAPSQLVLQSYVRESAEGALALLLAASPARPPQVVRSSDAPVAAATLARWQRLPAGPAIGAGSVPLDVHSAPTDARWLWLAALLALGIEWLMRRRRAKDSAAAVSAVRPADAPDTASLRVRVRA